MTILCWRFRVVLTAGISSLISLDTSCLERLSLADTRRSRVDFKSPITRQPTLIQINAVSRHCVLDTSFRTTTSNAGTKIQADGVVDVSSDAEVLAAITLPIAAPTGISIKTDRILRPRRRGCPVLQTASQNVSSIPNARLQLGATSTRGLETVAIWLTTLSLWPNDAYAPILRRFKAFETRLRLQHFPRSVLASRFGCDWRPSCKRIRTTTRKEACIAIERPTPWPRVLMCFKHDTASRPNPDISLTHALAALALLACADQMFAAPSGTTMHMHYDHDISYFLIVITRRDNR